METITNINSDKPVSPKEIWNGRKSADQLSIDYEATEVFLNLLEENWETLCDTKTGKKQIWDTIANGLEEAGFAVRGSEKGKTCKNKWENLRKEYRTFLSKYQTGSAASATKKKPKFFNEIEKIIGSNNHSYKPPYVSDSLAKTQNPAKFQVKNNEPNDEITCNNENGEKQDVNQALCEKLEQSKKEDKDVSDSAISDTEIYNDSLDEKSSNDGKPKQKKKKPSKASKSEKVLEVFKDMRNSSNKRHLEERQERQKRHDERMQKSQQMIDVMKSLITVASNNKTKKSTKNKHSHKKKGKSTSSRDNHDGHRKRSTSRSTSKESSSSSDESSNSHIGRR